MLPELPIRRTKILLLKGQFRNRRVSLKGQLKSLLTESDSLKEEFVNNRRFIHSRPELSFEEVDTSKYIRDQLNSIGLEVKAMGGTGIVARFGLEDRPAIALRSELDALPVEEQTGQPYTSKYPGKMHACGHDAHMAILLGVAKLLQKYRRHLGCEVYLIFQPAEESETSGAIRMIDEGAINNVDAILALHVDPQIDVGRIGIRRGVMNAACDTFFIRIIGEGGHGAHPHRSIDAIPIASTVVNELQKVVSRRISPIRPVVISIGTIEGGTAPNVVSDQVRMSGTLRTLDAETRESAPKLMRQILSGISEAHGGDFEFELNRGEPPLRNDDKMVDFARETLAEVFPKESLVALEDPVMGGDDFAYYLEHVPGLMLRLGVDKPGDEFCPPLHHPRFDIEESSLPIGVAALTSLVLRFPRVTKKILTKEIGS